jgi:hypothetical protein
LGDGIDDDEMGENFIGHGRDVKCVQNFGGKSE